uniref:HEAT repeat-containing protein 1 n=1 Tax=Spongospora subterranea TaxID=70186 RepID=A0A0H5R8C6_9EUKA|eukprot:CRZ09957.1 hypothetical protein [Spongospora subterranea]
MGASRLASQLQALSSQRQSAPASTSRQQVSLIYDGKQASQLDNEAIFHLAQTALHELAKIDGRFRRFADTIFQCGAWQSDPDLLNKANNAKMAGHILDILSLLSGKFLLTAAHHVIEYLIRHHRVHQRNADQFICMILPYHETPLFARALSFTALSGKWSFLSPYVARNEGYCRSIFVQRAADHVDLFQTILSIASSGADLAKTGDSNRAAIAFSIAVILAVIERKHLSDLHLRAILPFLHNSLSYKKTPSMELRLLAQVAAAAIAPKLDDKPIRSLLTAMITGIDAHAGLDHITKSIQYAVAIFIIRSSVVCSDKALRHLASIPSIPAALSHLRSSLDVSAFVDMLIKFSIRSDNLQIASSLILQATDMSSDSVQRYAMLAEATSNSTDLLEFRRQIGHNCLADDSIFSSNPTVRLDAFRSYEKRVVSGELSHGFASTLYHDCIEDRSPALVMAVINSASAIAIMGETVLCSAIERALPRFKGNSDLVLASVQCLARIGTDSAIVMLVDIVIAHPTVLSRLSPSSHPLFTTIQDSLASTIASNVSAAQLPFVLDLISTRPALFPVISLIPMDGQSLDLILTSLTRFKVHPSTLTAFDELCCSLSSSAIQSDQDHRLFEICSEHGAVRSMAQIIEQQKLTFTFLIKMWGSLSLTAVVSALRIAASLIGALPHRNLAGLVPLLIPSLAHQDERVRSAALNVAGSIIKCHKRVAPFCGEPFADDFAKCNSSDLPTLRKFARLAYAKSKEIYLDRSWIARLEFKEATRSAVFRRCPVMSTATCASVLAGLQIKQISAAQVSLCSGLISDRTCSILIPLIAAHTTPKAVAVLQRCISCDNPAAIVNAASIAITQDHFRVMTTGAQTNLIVALCHLLRSPFAHHSLLVLSKLQISPTLAIRAVETLSEASELVLVLDCWSEGDCLVGNLTQFVITLLSLIDAQCESDALDSLLICSILKFFNTLPMKQFGSIVCNQKTLQCLRMDRQVRLQMALLFNKYFAERGVDRKSFTTCDVLSSVIATLVAGDGFALSVLIDSMNTQIPDSTCPIQVISLFIESWSAIPESMRSDVFTTLISVTHLLGEILLGLVSQYGSECFAFAHSIAERCSSAEQLLALAHMLSSADTVRPIKKIKSESPCCLPAVEFVAHHLDYSPFVSSVVPSAETESAFITIYRVMLNESTARNTIFDQLLHRLVAISSLSMFISALSNLLKSCQESETVLRRKTLQLLNEKLELIGQNGTEARDLVPIVDSLLPALINLVTNTSESDQNKQLALLVIDSVSNICPSDVVAPFIDVIPRIVVVMSTGSSNLQSSALMTVATCVANLGPHAIRFLQRVMPSVLSHISKSQTAGLHGLCAIVSSIPKFMGPYLSGIFTAITDPAIGNSDIVGQIMSHIASNVSIRVVLPTILSIPSSSTRLLDLISDIVTNHISPAELKAYYRPVFDLCISSFSQHVDHIDDHAVAMFTALALRLNEAQLSSLFASLLQWAGPSFDTDDRRFCTLFAVVISLLDSLETLFAPYARQMIDLCAASLCHEDASPRLYQLAIQLLHKTCLHDDGELVSKPRYDIIKPAFVEQIKIACATLRASDAIQFATDFIVPCSSQFASTFNHEMYWQPFIHDILLLTRSNQNALRNTAFQCIHGILDRIGDPLLPLLPEMIPYIVEAMEDADPDVERTVRRLVDLLQRLSGEDLQDYINK